MNLSLSRALESLRSSIVSSYDAWATWRDSAANAHCAAVMGSSVTRHLRFTQEYTVADSINSDASLTEVIDALKGIEPRLQDKIEDHLSWVMETAERGVFIDLTTYLVVDQMVDLNQTAGGGGGQGAEDHGQSPQ